MEVRYRRFSNTICAGGCTGGTELLGAAVSETINPYIACCQQCEVYKEVRLQNSGKFVLGYCLTSGNTLTLEPIAVSIPADCPRGLGYPMADEHGWGG